MSKTANSSAPVAAETAIGELVSFALEVLPTMRLASGLYCFDRSFSSGELRGESVRYSLMVLLGLQRADAAGYPVGDETSTLLDLCLSRQASFTPGDVGLALWADAREDGDATPDLLHLLGHAVSSDATLSGLVGMEIGWLLVGLAHAVERDASAAPPLRLVIDHLRQRRRAASGLFYHDGRSRLRRRLPNFATQIYTLLALAMLAQHGLDDGATADAERLADQLLRLQMPDGGWPWLFDADRAEVVERYEMYSVHQDAMAPMALLELSALTGDHRYAKAAGRGLPWSTGGNELGVNLLDRSASFAHRSIRRAPPWNRVAPAGNGAAALILGRPLRLSSRSVELNQTCRSYHLGWILEAWAGREGALAVADHD